MILRIVGFIASLATCRRRLCVARGGMTSRELGLWLLEPARSLAEVEQGTRELLTQSPEPLALCMASWSLASKASARGELYKAIADAITRKLDEVCDTARGAEAIANTARAFATAWPDDALFDAIANVTAKRRQAFSPAHFALIARCFAVARAQTNSSTLPFGVAAPVATSQQVAGWGRREIRDFVTRDEAEALVAMASWESSLANADDANVRTSLTATLPSTPLVDRIAERAAKLFGLDRSHCEMLQLVKYTDQSHYYHTHLDAFDEGNVDQLLVGGQRIATVLIYLTTNENGGGTQFDDRIVQPQFGTAIAWPNVLPNGDPDPSSAHAALPLTPPLTEKIAINCWLRAFQGADKL